MIEVRNLSKHYGDNAAIDDLDFAVRHAVMTGFLGANGATKPTTMRMTVELDRPDRGTITVNDRPFRQHRAPVGRGRLAVGRQGRYT